eukprot:COSAG02_NODE_2301_length_9188_cov_2.263615_3_plen_63_part_00
MLHANTAAVIIDLAQHLHNICARALVKCCCQTSEWSTALPGVAGVCRSAAGARASAGLKPCV